MIHVTLTIQKDVVACLLWLDSGFFLLIWSNLNTSKKKKVSVAYDVLIATWHLDSIHSNVGEPTGFLCSALNWNRAEPLQLVHHWKWAETGQTTLVERLLIVTVWMNFVLFAEYSTWPIAVRLCDWTSSFCSGPTRTCYCSWITSGN